MNTYSIVCDSGCDLTNEMKSESKISLVPLKIMVDNLEFTDHELDIRMLLEAIKLSKNGPKTACPSPNDYYRAFEQNFDEPTFGITLSSNLSGSYNSAKIALELINENYPKKKIHIFDSLSASAGETLIAMTLDKLCKMGNSFEDIIAKIEKIIKSMQTFFVLDNLDTLIKNGRVSKLKGAVASMLSFRPIMGSDGSGNIKLYENLRGTFNALTRLAEIVSTNCGEFCETIVVSHCNNLERAQFFLDMVQKKGVKIKNHWIVETAGLSATYANTGGIVVAYVVT